jgi:hypothetical protein
MQVVITIRTSQSQFPGGTVGGNWRIELSLPSDPPSVVLDYEGPSASANFDLQDGEIYNARGYRLDAAGEPLGPIATTQFTAGSDVVTLDVAGSISGATAMPAPKRK